MSPDEGWPFPPGLLGSAGDAIRGAILDELHVAGINDLSVPEATVLTEMAASEPGPTSTVEERRPRLGRQVDDMVRNGYLERSPTPGGEPTLAVTERGQLAANAVRRARSRLSERLGEQVPADWLDQARRVLSALSDLGGTTGRSRSRGREAAQLQRISPMFAVRDLAAAMEHYRALGFEVRPDDGGGHAWVRRERAGIHLLVDHDHDPTHGGLAYIRVADALALYEEWTAVETTHPVRLTPYGMQEGAHVDPDGNEILFGEPVDETDA
jgi:DNA-binding MarR family transcriptional regulator